MTTPAAAPLLAAAAVSRAKAGVAVAFVTAGFGFASFASRAPAVKAGLGIGAGGLGLLLLCLAVGAMVAMPFTGAIAHKAGTARAVLLGGALQVVGLSLAAAGLAAESTALTAVGLFVTGTGVSTWDVAMNVEGAAVERLLGRSVMARFHAGYSLGTILGAVVGAAAAAASLPLPAQLAGTVAVIAVLVPVATRAFTPRVPRAPGAATSRALVLRAWRDRRTLLVGVMVLAFAFAEGVANDWTAVAFVDGLDASEAVGAAAFAAFVAAMTLGRVFGGAAIDRWGRLAVLRVSATTAGCGVLLVVTAPAVPLGLAGAVLWGLGAALGFPTGMSAAADNREQAALHVAVVSAIGYTAFLLGPPIVGYLGDRSGVRDALVVVVAALALAFVVAPAARPLRR